MEKETCKNRFGIDIVKCCASCIHNIGMNNEHTRVCDGGEGIVKPSSLCKNWEMKRKKKNGKPGEVDLDSAGKGNGKIKKKNYINFFVDYPKPKNVPQHIMVDIIRNEYTKKYGSIYIND